MQPLSPSQRETMELAVATYQGDVTTEAVRYLLGRGITEETADTFRLGSVGNPVPGHERFRGMLAIPYLNRDGEPLSLRFRCIEDHNHRDYYHGKYMSITDEPSRTFNVGAIHKATSEVHVCEGEFDAIILNQIGLPAIAIPGVQAWSGHHRRMLAGFSRTWLWADPDEAGADFTNKVTRSLRSAKSVRLKHGDVSDTFKKLGAQAIYNLIEREVRSA